MSRVLIVERDAPGRTMMERVLEAASIPADSVGTCRDVDAGLDRGVYSVALVDELAGNGSLLDEVRLVRARWPSVSVIATGTLLSQRVLLELLRLGVVDALPKPFLPQDLRDVVVRARTRPQLESVDFAAALSGARAGLIAGDETRARSSIARAHAAAPLDPEVVALDALLAEISGQDARADQLYRVALVLHHDEGGAPDPSEGIERVASYAAARPVDSLPRDRVVVVGKPAKEGEIALHTVGVGGDRIHLRRAGDRMFATSLGDDRPESITRVLEVLGAARLEVGEASSIDTARVTQPPNK